MTPAKSASPKRPSRRRKFFKRVPTPFFVIAFIVALPAIIPYAIVSHWLEMRRLRTAAKTQACPSCGRIPGIASLHAADEHWRAHVAELHRKYPGARFRLMRLVQAICIHCGTHLSFRENTFHPHRPQNEPPAKGTPL
jgi:hypothetical protein